MSGVTGLLLAAASSAARVATPARRPPLFDPASTLGWSVPLVVLALLFGFLMLISGVRSRRGAFAIAVLTLIVSLAAALLVAWARFGKPEPYRISFQWINISVAFTGATQFQGFGIDVVLRLDHLALAAACVVLLSVLGIVVWNRAGGRAEPGPVRMHALALLFVFCAVGVVFSGDAAELFAFWGLAGAASFLLLGQRWGTDAGARAGRLALALPFVFDLCLFSAIAIVYSRYGILDPEKLPRVLHLTSGWGYRSLTLAALLVLVAVAGRAGVFPFHSWITGGLDAPPAALALMQSVWPLLAALVFLRFIPVFLAALPLALHVAAIGLGIAAVAGPILALFGNDPRRSLTLAGTGASALVLLAVNQAGSTAVAVALAIAPARAGAVLSAVAVVAAVRSADLVDIGEIWRRMRFTAVGLLASSVVLVFATAPAGAAMRSANGHYAFYAAMILLGFAIFRVYLAAAHGPLRRRRAFEPTRVRELPGPARGALLFLALVGLLAGVLVGLAPVTGWLGYLGGPKHSGPALSLLLPFELGGLTGAALAVVAFLGARRASLRLSARAGAQLGAAWVAARMASDRFLERPALSLVDGLEGSGLATGEGRMGEALVAAGRGLLGSPPVLPALLALAVLLAVVFGIFSPGVLR